MKRGQRIVLPTLALMGWGPLARAHMGDGAGGGFAAGFMHPILGWDHVIAMVAVGLWMRATALLVLALQTVGSPATLNGGSISHPQGR